MRRYAVLAIAITSLLVGCGGGGSDEQEIRDTVEGFFQALGEDTAEAYSFLAEECREGASFSDFAAQLQLSAFFAANEVRAENVGVIERGDDEIVADVDIVLVIEGEGSPLADGGLGRVRVVKESGRWRLADCENFLAPEWQNASIHSRRSGASCMASPAPS
jgi:hypothetical protein